MKRMLMPLAAASLVLFTFQNCSRTDFSAASADSSALTLSFKQYQPALAVRSTVCMNCHANIQGNLVTDFLQSNGTASFLDLSGDGKGGEFIYPNYGHGDRMFWGTSFIGGTIYVPPVTLNASAQTTINPIIAEDLSNLSQLGAFTQTWSAASGYPAPNAVGLTSNTDAAPTRISEYLNVALNGRSAGYRSWLANFPTAYTKINTLNLADTPIQEVSSVKIGAPTAADIRAQITAGQPYTYFPTASQLALSGFKLSANGKFYQNDPSTPLSCDGDLLVDAPVALINLQVQTVSGCRIYSTGTIFVQGSTSYNGGEGVAFTGGANANLQLSSAVGISLGLGQCSAAGLASNVDSYANATSALGSTIGGRMQIPYGRLDLLTPMFADYQKITDANGSPLLSDAGDCAGPASAARKVSFNHVLLNAPRVDSRYSGDFNGVLIAEMFMGSLGGVIYTYDSTFENVSILPRLNQGSIFDIEACGQPSAASPNLSLCK